MDHQMVQKWGGTKLDGTLYISPNKSLYYLQGNFDEDQINIQLFVV